MLLGGVGEEIEVLGDVGLKRCEGCLYYGIPAWYELQTVKHQKRTEKIYGCR